MRREILTAITTVLSLTIATAPAQQFDLSWHSIDAGGVIKSNGGAFELSGTIGQPDAGVLSGGIFELTGGFWFEIPPTDCNEDGAVNLLDHSSLTDCLSGPIGSVPAACDCFDVNGNGSVDLRDFALSQIEFFNP